MPLSIGTKAPDFTIPLSTGLEFNLYRTLKKGPVIINFIKGTWCPDCQAHMAALQNWQAGLQKRNATILVISTEEMTAIREWTANHGIKFLFGSDSEEKVTRAYGIIIPVFGFTKPAVFVVDSDQTVRMMHKGIRNDALHVDVDKIVDEIYGQKPDVA